jgi:hypothetical protein
MVSLSMEKTWWWSRFTTAWVLIGRGAGLGAGVPGPKRITAFRAVRR